MPDLEARSTLDPARNWRLPLSAGPVVLSRTPLPPDQLPPNAVNWTVPWAAPRRG